MTFESDFAESQLYEAYIRLIGTENRGAPSGVVVGVPDVTVYLENARTLIFMNCTTSLGELHLDESVPLVIRGLVSKHDPSDVRWQMIRARMARRIDVVV